MANHCQFVLICFVLSICFYLKVLNSYFKIFDAWYAVKMTLGMVPVCREKFEIDHSWEGKVIHSQDWPMSNFSCQPHQKYYITQYDELMVFHTLAYSDERWSYLPILTISLIRFSYERLRECSFLTLEWRQNSPIEKEGIAGLVLARAVIGQPKLSAALPPGEVCLAHLVGQH